MFLLALGQKQVILFLIFHTRHKRNIKGIVTLIYASLVLTRCQNAVRILNDEQLM